MLEGPRSQPSKPNPSSRLSRLLLTFGLSVALMVGWGGAPTAAKPVRDGAAEITINNPLGGPSARRAITDHLIGAIDGTPARGRIRIASWNVRSQEIVAALVRAHRRNVTIRLIMSAGNAGKKHPNKSVRLLRQGLREANNARRPVSRRSQVVRCTASCRGTKGIAHSKFFLFSRSQGNRWVVMNGSFNATDVAATRQWNDLVTFRGRKDVYLEFLETFRQMYKDQPVRQKRIGKRARSA